MLVMLTVLIGFDILHTDRHVTATIYRIFSSIARHDSLHLDGGPGNVSQLEKRTRHRFISLISTVLSSILPTHPLRIDGFII